MLRSVTPTHHPRSTAAPAVETQGLVVRYPGGATAVDGIDLRLDQGEVLGLLGPNGSGKSTLFRVLATLLRPTAGIARVLGHDVCDDPNAVRRQIAVLFQNPALDRELSSRENLACHGRLFGLSRQIIEARGEALLRRVGLIDRADEPIKRFSGGMRRRVEIAKCLLCEPPLLLMDEPTIGLDPTARREVWDLLAQLRADREITVLVTTHLLDEGMRCDRLVLMNRGRIAAEGAPMELIESLGFQMAVIVPRDPEDLPTLRQGVEKLLGLEPGRIRPAGSPGTGLVIADPEAGRLVQTLLRHKEDLPPLQEVGLRQPTLDDVFEHYTGQALATA